MFSIKDDRGYNQGFAPSKTLVIRTKRRCQIMMDEMELTKNVDVLEIGCGTGEISNLIASTSSAKVLGTDLCIPFIEEAKEKYILPNLSFEVLNFNKPETLQGKQFDYIIGNGILHHLYYNLDEALKNIRFLLKPNGKMIFLEPNLKNPYCYVIFSFPYFRKLAHLEPDEMAFTRKFIQNKLKTAGFQNIKVSYKDFLLPIIPVFLIKSVIFIGNIAEKIFGINRMSQSIFIVANK
ncbi:MAG: class I SAM-dependent methyltransferase [Bacteroidetes bacterium]|nr:class I SAM-dependent methyltransferase [Bacteroidota bacterium]